MFKWIARMNLIQKLVFFFVLLIVIPILLAYWFVSTRVAAITEGQMGDTLLQLVKTSHLTLDRDIVGVDGTTEKLIFTPETQSLFDTSSQTEYERLQGYLVMDKLLNNYSKNSLNFALFIPSMGYEYPFAPESDVKPNGVFFSCDTSPGSWFQTAVNHRGSGFIKVINQFGDNRVQAKTTAYIRSMNTDWDSHTPAGVLAMTGLDVLLTKDMELLRIPKGGQIVLLGSGNEILANTENFDIGDTFQMPSSIFRSLGGVYIEREGGASWMYAIHSSPDSQTKLLFKIPLRSIIGEHEAVRSLVNYLMIVYFCILLAVSMSFVRYIVSPLSRLVRLTRSYEPGRPLAVESGMNRNDEIGLLNRSFIEMTKRLNQTIHDKYDLELKQKEAELTILHSQINPHLLYNTLESIFWRITAEGKTDTSAEMIRDLSLLMRIGLSRGKTLIPIAEELNHVEAYLRLQLKRYNYSFAIHWDVEEDAKEYLIPKVVLQPLVENAIVHGIRRMNQEGALWIGIRRAWRAEAETMVLTIEDNGYRRADIRKLNEIVGELRPNEGFGIRNVHQRIKLHFGEAYGLAYEAREEGGVRAVLTIPATVTEPG